MCTISLEGFNSFLGVQDSLLSHMPRFLFTPQFKIAMILKCAIEKLPMYFWVKLSVENYYQYLNTPHRYTINLHYLNVKYFKFCVGIVDELNEYDTIQVAQFAKVAQSAFCMQIVILIMLAIVLTVNNITVWANSNSLHLFANFLGIIFLQ